MKYKLIILLLFLEQIFSEYCDIDQNCTSCERCYDVESNYCTCSFHNNFCFNEVNNLYSYNSTLINKYDQCPSSTKKELQDICGKSSFSNEIGKDNFYQFFSFNDPELLKDNNIFCHYLFTCENEKLKEDLILEIDVNIKKESLTEKSDNKNLMLIFAEDFNSNNKTLYSLNLNKIAGKKYTLKAPQYKKISLYISLIKNNGILNDNELISMNLGVKRDTSYAQRLKKYKITIIIFCVVCIICVSTCFIIFLIKYKRSRELYRLRAIEMADNNDEMTNRMDPEEKKKKLKKLFDTKLKKRKYLKKDNINVTTACSICLEEFIENVSEVSITPCMHIFHYDCLNNWLFMENSKCLCPYCNNNLLSDKPPAKRHIDKENEKNFINEKANILDKLDDNKKKRQNDINSSERVIKKQKKENKDKNVHIDKVNANENNNIINNEDNNKEEENNNIINNEDKNKEEEKNNINKEDNNKEENNNINNENHQDNETKKNKNIINSEEDEQQNKDKEKNKNIINNEEINNENNKIKNIIKNNKNKENDKINKDNKNINSDAKDNK